MKGDENRKVKVVVVEDATPDRIRYRSILEMKGIDFFFAWDATKNGVPDVEEVISLIEQGDPDILILDLCWTPEDDFYMDKLRFKTDKEIAKFKKRLEDEHKNWISGIRLLDSKKWADWLGKRGKERDPLEVLIATQYAPPVAHGLKWYLKQKENKNMCFNIFHKWREEDELIDKLGECAR